ncbi:MAG: aroK [Geobacteraceae bacterium]|jgi:shikimate kinase|nr:aroK [Geobacteraceae bacterium]
MKNIVLTGFMGTGKSIVGERLAGKLGYRYCDMDALITERAGMSINQIFALHGEVQFRDLETEMIEEIAHKERLVISTGGGAVLRDKNRKLLREKGVIINLVTSAEEIYSRICSDSSRPLLKDDMSLPKIQTMLKSRESYYADADIRIDTTGKKVEDVVDEIVCRLEGIRGFEDSVG